MNEFIEASENLSRQLLPILGVAVLICLMILFIHLIKTVKKVREMLNKADTTVDLANRSIEKLQAPLDTVARISKTVDNIHEGAVHCAKQIKDAALSSMDEIKNKYFNKSSEKEEDKEPSPEDIIGG